MTFTQGLAVLHRTVAFFAVLSGTFASPAAALTACLPPDGGKARITSVADNGVLILKGHRTVKLEGLLWPSERDAARRRQATAALRQFASGHEIHLRVGMPKLDRYERLRAQVVLPDGTWLQQALLLRGLVRVSIAPDRRECAQELYAAEEKARNEGLGLWALPAYAVRHPESLHWSDLGTFQIIGGRVLNVKVSGGRAYLNFGRDWRTDFTVTIAPEDMKTFRHADFDPHSYAGKRVGVRGFIDRLHGYEIEAAAPEAIEVVN